MDKESGPSAEDFRREQLQRVSIITSKNVPAGIVYRTENGIICSPTNDLVWDHTWASFLMKQRKIGSNYVKRIADDLRFKLGLHNVGCPIGAVPPETAALRGCKPWDFYDGPGCEVHGPGLIRNTYRPQIDRLLKDDVGRLVRYGGYSEKETRQ